MKREEKKQISREKILKSALEEFSNNSYDKASVNTICINGGISKGNLYHYFQSKDEIYLYCVDNCFKEMVESLSNLELSNDVLHDYLLNRFRFFEKKPYYKNIFFYAILQPPKHLKDKIFELKKELDEFNQKIFIQALKCMELRDGVTLDDALNYYLMFQEVFNSYYSMHLNKDFDFENMVCSHEKYLLKMLDLMLYGIVKGDV